MKRILFVGLFALLATRCLAQIQSAWVKRYSLVSSATNQATAMALSPEGNIIVAGSSAGTNGDLDYTLIKYAPNGQQLWLARYDSPTNGADQLRGMAVDTNGTVVVTGTSKTVKFNSVGVPIWTAPYGGRAVAVDTNGNSYVTGFSELDYVTVKLDPNGTNLWLRTFTYDTSTNYPDISQVIAVGESGAVVVSGFETWLVDRSGYHRQPRSIAYDNSGALVWTDESPFCGGLSCLYYNAASAIMDRKGQVVLMGNIPGGPCFETRRVDQNGNAQWGWGLDSDSQVQYAGDGRAMAVDNSGSIYLTGYRVSGYTCCTVKLGTNGHKVWLSTYNGPEGIPSQGNAIALDSSGNVYVTGCSYGNVAGKELFTLKYDNNGNQLWVQRYDGPAHGDDIATGIVVDNQGGVYVSGYSATTSGGTEFVTIKYSELPNIQKKPDGSIQLQFFGSPGSNYGFQATTNFQNWTNLGSAAADTNGLFQFLDTNAPSFPYRFYRYYAP